jgi:hypothetical protein
MRQPALPFASLTGTSACPSDGPPQPAQSPVLWKVHGPASDGAVASSMSLVVSFFANAT